MDFFPLAFIIIIIYLFIFSSFLVHFSIWEEVISFLSLFTYQKNNLINDIFFPYFLSTCFIYIVGAYYLESTIKTVCIGPMIQWPNSRMAE